MTYKMDQKGVKDGISLTNSLNGGYILRQGDPMINAKRLVLFNIAEDSRLTEINKDRVLLDLEPVDLQENVSLSLCLGHNYLCMININ